MGKKSISPGFTDLTHKKDAFLKVFERNATNVQEACRKIRVSRQTYYNWLKSDPAFSETIEGIREAMIDYAESALFKAIKKGNITAIIFTLKTRGKERGYVEKEAFQERPCHLCAKYSVYENMTLEELRAEKARLEKSLNSTS